MASVFTLFHGAKTLLPLAISHTATSMSLYYIPKIAMFISSNEHVKSIFQDDKQRIRNLIAENSCLLLEIEQLEKKLHQIKSSK